MTKETILASIVRELERQNADAGCLAATMDMLDTDALAAAIERDLALKWTRERPTVPGYYWMRGERYEQSVMEGQPTEGDCYAET